MIELEDAEDGSLIWSIRDLDAAKHRADRNATLLSVSSYVRTAALTYNATTVIPTTARCNWQLSPICQKFCIAWPVIHFGCLAATIMPAAAATIQSMIRMRGKNLQKEFHLVRGVLYIRESLWRRASIECRNTNSSESCDLT